MNDKVVLFPTQADKDAKVHSDAVARVLAYAALRFDSRPSVEEIHEHVKRCPTLTFQFAQRLVVLHGWSVDSACTFIKKHYQPRP